MILVGAPAFSAGHRAHRVHIPQWPHPGITWHDHQTRPYAGRTSQLLRPFAGTSDEQNAARTTCGVNGNDGTRTRDLRRARPPQAGRRVDQWAGATSASKTVANRGCAPHYWESIARSPQRRPI